MRVCSDKRSLPIDKNILPLPLVMELQKILDRGVKIDEIRLRTGRVSTVTSDGANISIDFVPDRECMERVLSEICEYSLYAHAHTICEGYITLDGGVRVGIVGRATLDGDRIIGVYDVSSLCFRIPRAVERTGHLVCELIRQKRGGVLVYSPPGVGKTTLLKSVISELADTSCKKDVLRISVVDTRDELSCLPDGNNLCVDILTGYPKDIGIEIAARTMNPQLIVCDELSGEYEIRGVIHSHNCGVPLLASAHALNVRSLLMREGFLRLHRAGAFAYYVGISRRKGERDYEYTVVSREEADGYF